MAAGVPVRSCGTLVREPPLYHFNGPIGYDSDNCNIAHVLDTHENSVDGRVRSRSRETMGTARALERATVGRKREKEKKIEGKREREDFWRTAENVRRDFFYPFDVSFSRDSASRDASRYSLFVDVASERVELKTSRDVSLSTLPGEMLDFRKGDAAK